MKLYELFDEPLLETLDVENASPEEIAEFIKTNCQPYLQNKHPNKWLKRGKSTNNELPFFETIRTDRRPKDLPIGVHNALNLILKKIGAPFDRTSCIFTSAFDMIGDDDLSDTYGTLYYVFPVGKFDVVWSTLFRDAYHHFDRNADRHCKLQIKLIQDDNKYRRLITGQYDITDLDDETLDQSVISKIEKSYKFGLSTLQQAMSRKREIMIGNCSRLLLLEVNNDFSEKVLSLL